MDSEYTHSLSTDPVVFEKYITELESYYKSQNMVSDSSFPQRERGVIDVESGLKNQRPRHLDSDR